MVGFTEEDEKPEHDEEEKERITKRRATKAVLQNDPRLTKIKRRIEKYTTAQKWWSKPPIQYAFSHPHVTARLEKLMGSNLVSLTDRDYMQKLEERIFEDYGDCMDKRIGVRENLEKERVKNLVLSGRIPFSEAPDYMADHPVLLIHKLCKKLIAERRAKIKIPKVVIPTHLYCDDTPDPPSGLSIENGHIFRKGTDKLCNPASRFLPPCDDLEFVEEESVKEDVDDEEEEEGEDAGNVTVEEAIKEEVTGEEVEEEEVVEDEFMFTRKQYNKLKYEAPSIKQLRKCEDVDELYELADEIIGILKTLNEEDIVIRQTSEDTLFSVATTSSSHPRERKTSGASKASGASKTSSAPSSIAPSV